MRFHDRARLGSAHAPDAGRTADPAASGPADGPARTTSPAADAPFACERCGAGMFRMHSVWRCPSCGFKTDCCGW